VKNLFNLNLLLDKSAQAILAFAKFLKVFFISLMWKPAMSYIVWCLEQSEDSQRQWTKILKLPMLLFTPIVAFVSPLGVFVIFAVVFVSIEQSVYPKHTVPERFLVSENINRSLNEKGALLFDAATYQLDEELKTTLGWCPNDVFLDWLDNRCERQIGVHYATRESLKILSVYTTKFGLGDVENKDTRGAREIIAYKVDVWAAMGLFPGSSENTYRKALKSVDKFIVNANESKELVVNIRTDDLKAVLDSMKNDVLQEPFGQLTTRNKNVKWFQLDNKVYFAQGAAIVARDILAVMRSSFQAELEKGGLENLDAAIDSLNAAAQFNPWLVARGDGDSMWADHRSKMARYFSEAFRRIEEVSGSLKI
jgi:hypothetical protein